ncbi:MAG: hypothetical protein HY313_11500 [Acidobacteria bacterium]|nr:hypothetical protein [Acidobacteriota bacterium]
MTIHSQAPTRIDLAGGTLDIWRCICFTKFPYAQLLRPLLALAQAQNFLSLARKFIA